MKLHLVTNGEDEGYQVYAVVDDAHLEKARRFAELVGGVVEESAIEMNAVEHDEPPAGMRFFVVGVKQSGAGMDGHSREALLDSAGKRHKEHWWVNDSSGVSEWQLNARLYARDRNAATTLVDDLRKQIVAGLKPAMGEF